MRIHLPLLLGIFALISPLFTASVARAQSPDQSQAAQAEPAQYNRPQSYLAQTDTQDDAVSPRVARLFSIQGDVSFQRSGDSDWHDATVNLPLLAGDQVYTGSGSRAVIQLDRNIFIAVAEKTDLSISQLDDSTGQFELPAGSAVIEAYGLKSAFDLLELDTPVSSVVLNADGVYRVDVDDDGATLAMVRSGSADVVSADGGLTLGAGRQAQVGPTGSGRLEGANLNSSDDWGLGEPDANAAALAQAGPRDEGTDESAASYPPAPDYVSTYENTYDGLYGADELSGYGTWTYYSTYGNIWLPRVGAGWTPYRLGRWIWIRSVGWTWMPSEPWGWATYHYGRWAFIPNFGWAWVPGFGPGRPAFVTGPSFYHWRPAVVAFFTFQAPTGRFVGWAPVAPTEKLHNQKSTAANAAGALPGNPYSSRGISVMPVSAFVGIAIGSPAAAGAELRPVVTHQPGRRQRSVTRITAGLGDIHPSAAAISPIALESNRPTAIVQPPASVANRAIVTRHLPSGSVAKSTGTGRERTLIKAPPAPLMSNARAGSSATVGKVTQKRTAGKTANRSRTGPVYAGTGRPTEPSGQGALTANGSQPGTSHEVNAGARAEGGNGGSSESRNASTPGRESERPAGSATGSSAQRPQPSHSAAPTHVAPAQSGGGESKKH
jgi:hypothetical protein